MERRCDKTNCKGLLDNFQYNYFSQASYRGSQTCSMLLTLKKGSPTKMSLVFNRPFSVGLQDLVGPHLIRKISETSVFYTYIIGLYTVIKAHDCKKVSSNSSHILCTQIWEHATWPQKEERLWKSNLCVANKYIIININNQ